MYQYYETEIATKIPKIHVVTQCNTTSFLHGVGKIKSIHYEVYYYSTADEAIVSDIFLQDNVWIVENKSEEVCPLWFTGMFLISCFHFHSNQQI